MTSRKENKGQIRLQSKFLLGLAAILVIFSAISSTIIYFHEKRALEQEIYEKSELVMTTMAANRSYVREILRPKMYSILKDDEFILEAMSSSYISRNVMERFNETLKDFIYRRVAIDARNPDYEANELEREMIHHFSENPASEEWNGMIEREGRKYFMRFQPVYTENSCNHCHGTPEQAPREILELYGSERGFNRAPGKIYGVISVAVPVDINLSKIKEIAFSVFIGVIPPILFLYVMISLFFNRVIVVNLQNLLDIFKSNLQDEKGRAYLHNDNSFDEISELTDVARQMSEDLHNNRIKLENSAEKILHAKETLQSVFDGITDPVVLINRDQRLRIVNKAFLKRYDLSLQKVLGSNINELDLDKSCPLTHCSAVFQDFQASPSNKLIETKDGEIFHVYFYPIRNELNIAESVVCYLKDITDQKRLEQKIQQTEKMVSLGQLAAGIAHEINNPLGVILCHIDLLQGEKNLSMEAESDLQIIKKHTGNCKNIIADLLNFSRQQSGVKKTYSLNTLIREIVSISANQLQQNDIAIDLSLSHDLPLLTMDIDRIKQVILNLILNSAFAIESDGFINISTHYKKGSKTVSLIVEDDGIGIPSTLLKKIFDPFYTTKAPGQGTGLGLSVSYGIIKDHDGEIVVESKEGKSSKFTITLPVLESSDE